MTDVPDLVQVADHFSLLAVILIAQAVPNLCLIGKNFIKLRDNSNTVCGAIRDLP